MCMKLKNGYQDTEIVNIDGYYLRCTFADKVDYIEVILKEGDSNNVLNLVPVKSIASAVFPCPTDYETEITKDTPRMGK